VSGTGPAAARFTGMPEEQRPAAVIGKEEARQGRPQGFVRTIMYISIALALIGMFVVYLVIKP
jgi:hypothetical protein